MSQKIVYAFRPLKNAERYCTMEEFVENFGFIPMYGLNQIDSDFIQNKKNKPKEKSPENLKMELIKLEEKMSLHSKKLLGKNISNFERHVHETEFAKALVTLKNIQTRLNTYYNADETISHNKDNRLKELDKIIVANKDHILSNKKDVKQLTDEFAELIRAKQFQ